MGSYFYHVDVCNTDHLQYKYAERSGAGWLAKVMQFNPLYHYVTFVRTIIIDGCSPAISEYFICAICSLVMIIIGGTVFKKTQDQFVLYI